MAFLCFKLKRGVYEAATPISVNTISNMNIFDLIMNRFYCSGMIAGVERSNYLTSVDVRLGTY